MTPEEGVTWLEQVMGEGIHIDMVAITGPGDPLAVPAPTLHTLRLVREKYPDVSLCLTTTGLGGDELAEELAEIGLSHITVLVDAVAPEVAEKLYAWIRPSTRTVPLSEGAVLLMNEQARAVTAFRKAGIPVKVNTTVYPGYNAGHVEEIAKAMALLGADIMAVVPFCPEGESEEFPGEPSVELLATVRNRAARHIDLMPAWEKCGESIVGTALLDGEKLIPSTLPKPTKERPNVAVVSSNGMDIDLHLGHASKLLIYGPREDGLACLLETRNAPAPGSGPSRWEQLASTLDDCFVLLAANAGERPRTNLSRLGISVIVTDEEIEGTVDVLYGGGKKKGKCRK